ncbi:hypothetical protein AMECASPLE_002766 [Ameca splendens]|uniref:Uncharacterized protein n=1 Tax=Ameca splendens TaxID=208324 RepID=A0ABV0XBG2_9TELE
MGCSTGVLHLVVVAGLSVLFVSPKRSVKKDTNGDYLHLVIICVTGSTSSKIGCCFLGLHPISNHLNAI